MRCILLLSLNKPPHLSNYIIPSKKVTKKLQPEFNYTLSGIIASRGDYMNNFYESISDNYENIFPTNEKK